MAVKSEQVVRGRSLILLLIMFIQSNGQKKIIVSKDEKGDFNSIQAALNSLPDSSMTPRVVLIKNGVYDEKIYVEKPNIIFEGEDRGGDTVSPWEINNGMWYFKDCVMEGGFDFYCPRG